MKLRHIVLIYVVMVLLVIGFSALVWLGIREGYSNSLGQQRCETTGREARRAVRYDSVNGCRIEHKGTFVPISAWKVTE